jgi:hypothetical protein
MKRRLTVTWQCSEDVVVDVPDGAFTADQISEIAEKAARHILPGGGDACDDHDWDWQGVAPKAKGEGNQVPDDYWFQLGDYEVATNGYLLVVRGCGINFRNDSIWRKINDPGKIGDLLKGDFASLPLHQGWFRNSFKVFSECRIVGNTPKPGINGNGCAGFALDKSGKLAAVLMPHCWTSKPDPEGFAHVPRSFFAAEFVEDGEFYRVFDR